MRNVLKIFCASLVFALLTVNTTWTHASAKTKANVHKHKTPPAVTVKKQRLAADTPGGKSGYNDAAHASHMADMIALEKEKQQLELENALQKARLEKELTALREELAKLVTKRELMVMQWQAEQAQKEKAHRTNMLSLSQAEEKLTTEANITQHKLNRANQLRRIVTDELTHEVQCLHAKIDKIQARRAKYLAERQDADYIDTAPEYIQQPLQSNGTLVISDRYIELNGVITPWKANYIADRVQYFNNKNAKQPIFIVIESSPGGSVHAGACILKAMEESQASVYVVVKSFAASMAALITTLADHSYAYPNAIILHHQPWTFTSGNLRALQEDQAHLQEWWRRLGGNLAKKMGIPLQKLDKLLYEKSASGDWLEFADQAQKLKWVNQTIQGIKHIGVRELPRANDYTEENYLKKYMGSTRQATSSTEKGVMCLPTLGVKDFYYLYNPSNQYQMHTPHR